MEITAVVIDGERTFADALAIRLNVEEDIKVVAVAQPNTTTTGLSRRHHLARRRPRWVHSVLPGRLRVRRMKPG